jgi:hypothetical protein
MSERQRVVQKSAIPATPALVPSLVRDVLRSQGAPLDASVRREMEPRIGHDFSRVRVHADPKAAASARAIGASAYSFGSHVVFGAGSYAPATKAGRMLLVHELAHVAQRPDESGPPKRVAAADSATEQSARAVAAGQGQDKAPNADAPPGEIKRASDPTNAALYPTVDERKDIRKVLDPEQEKAEETGKAPDLVTDPKGFEIKMVTQMRAYIDTVFPNSEATKNAKVKVSSGDLTSLSDFAEEQMRAFYSVYAGAAKVDVHLHDHVHFVSSNPGANELSKLVSDWVASRMQKNPGGGSVMAEFHVLPGRDAALFKKVHDAIIAERGTKLDTILKYMSGYEYKEEAYIQPNIATEEGDDEAITRRRGRWATLGTLTHEMMHQLAHPDFTEAAHKVSQGQILIEGMAEYFARQVYNDIVQRAAKDKSLRLRVEGDDGPKFDPPAAGSYGTYVQALETLKTHWIGEKDDNDNDTGMRPDMAQARTKGVEESYRAAFFLGRVEFIGLGEWKAEDWGKYHSKWVGAAFPHNTISAGVALDAGGSGTYQVRARYGRVVAGAAGPLKLDIGAGLSYLGPGQSSSARLGGSVDVGLRYEWPNLYVGATAGLGVSGRTGSQPSNKDPTTDTPPLNSAVRLDFLPGLEAGVRIGIVKVGAGVTVIIPAGSKSAAEKKPLPMMGGGVSFVF